MWMHIEQLKRLGFRSVGGNYWWCERGHDLPAHAHLSIYVWGRKHSRRIDPPVVEVNAFHVTFEHRGNNIHFYYHDRGNREWEPGGHTHVQQLQALGVDPRRLRTVAHRVAGQFATALGGALRSRRAKPRGEIPRER